MQTSNPYEYLQGHVLERGETSTYVKRVSVFAGFPYGFPEVRLFFADSRVISPFFSPGGGKYDDALFWREGLVQHPRYGECKGFYDGIKMMLIIRDHLESALH